MDENGDAGKLGKTPRSSFEMDGNREWEGSDGWRRRELTCILSELGGGSDELVPDNDGIFLKGRLVPTTSS